MTRRALLSALALAATPAAAAADRREVWRDAARARDVPVLLRLPDAAGPRPVVVVSHGLGGSREGLAYLGRAFAGAGFVAVHLQHAGTDSAIWQGGGPGLAAAALDPSNALARLQDGIFAVGEVLRRGGLAGDALTGRVDAARIAVAGHSYGAWTVQHLLGQLLPGGDRGLGLPDARLRAGIALSPSPPRGLPPRAAFADEAAAGPRWADPTYHARTAAVAVLFLRAVLEGDAEARAALVGGARDVLDPADRIETRGF